MEEQITSNNANPTTTTIQCVEDLTTEDLISEADQQLIGNLKNNFAELYGNIKFVSHGSRNFCDVFQYIKSNYFYESLANFNVQTRLSKFFDSLKIGDKFVAKVSNVFERSADVLLVWSSKRDILDLKIKAYLKLIDSKRYSRSNHHSSYSRYSQQNNDVRNDRNLEISELVYVQVVSFNESTKKVEVIRCKDLGDDQIIVDDDTNENDDGILDEGKYKSKSSADISFRDYMREHCDLRNPALIKQQPFTSLQHQAQVIDCLKRKLLKCSAPAIQTDDRETDIITIDSDSRQNSTEPSHNGNVSKTPTRSTAAGGDIPHNQLGQDNSKANHSTPNSKNNNKRGLDSESKDNKNEAKHKRSDRSLSKNRKHSSTESDSDSSSSSNSSSSSSDDSRRKRKRKSHHKKKSHRHEKRKHKKKSSNNKGSEKSSTKKKSKKNKDKRSTQHHHHSKQKKKINDKILKLLNLA